MGINDGRFLPVKKTSDLLLVMSNLYSLEQGRMVMSPRRMFPSTPLVKLGTKHFQTVTEFLQRFGSIPDLIELDHLTVSGDVTFGRGVRGRNFVDIIVIIIHMINIIIIMIVHIIIFKTCPNGGL